MAGTLSAGEDVGEVGKAALGDLEQHALVSVEAGDARKSVRSHLLHRQTDGTRSRQDRLQLGAGLSAVGEEQPAGFAPGVERLCHRAAAADDLAHRRSTVTTAYAAIPSSPAKPSPSDVVPFTLTLSASIARPVAMASRISSRRGAMEGRRATMTRSTVAGRQPASL